MSQVEKLYEILKDGQPHRSDELVEKVYGVGEGTWLARLGARVYDLKQKYCLEIEGWKDQQKPKLYWYQIVNPGIKTEPTGQKAFAF